MMTSTIKISDTIGKGYNRFWNSRNFYRVVKGSRGSKKSKTAALWYIIHIMKYEWANVLVIRRFSTTNRQSTYTDLKWACTKLGVTHLFKFNESLPEITYKPTGQKIIFRGLDDELKITSITVDVGILCWAWFEEAYQIENSDKFDTVVESIRGRHDDSNFFKQITVTFNPWNEKHWLKKAFFDPKTRKHDTLALTTTFRLNEWLDEVDIKRHEDLYKTNPRRARIVNDGEWGVAEGLVFDNFSVQNFNKQAVIQSAGHTAHGMDFGFTNDPTTLPSIAVNFNTMELHIYDELYKHSMLTKDIAAAVKRRNLHRSVIYADAAEPRMIAELNENHGLNIRSAPKPKGSISQGLDYMKQFKIIIHPDCVHTAEEFETYAYKRDKVSGEYLNDPIDDNNHVIDAIRYALSQYHIKPKETNTKRKLATAKRLFG